MFRTSLFVGILSAGLIANAQGFEFNQTLNCNWIEPIQTGYLQNHLIFKAKDKELQNRVIEQYIKRVDPLKIYMTETDVQKIKDLMKDVFANIEKKDCKFMTEIQELLREVNTIGSKSQVAGITEAVVEAKTLIERIREQVQNVE